jgi:hypothetical protein
VYLLHLLLIKTFTASRYWRLILVLLHFQNQLVVSERRWIPAFAGSEWGIRIACDPPTQQSSHAGDDDFEANRSLNATPAQSGITTLGPTASQTSSRRRV